jgi:chromosome segregation ATPase
MNSTFNLPSKHASLLMTSDNAKIVLTARVDSDLKERLSQDAANMGLSLSNFTEYCLSQFPIVVQQTENLTGNNHQLCQRLEGLTERVEWQQNEIQERDNQLTRLKTEQRQLSQSLEASEKREALAVQNAQTQSAENDALNQRIYELEQQLQAQIQQNKTVQQAIKSLENRVSNTTTQLEEATRKNCEVTQQLSAVQQQNQNLHHSLGQRLPIVMKEQYQQKVLLALESLKSIHSEYTDDELLALTVATMEKTETSIFTSYTLKDYKKRNPDFFTLKTIVSQ